MDSYGNLTICENGTKTLNLTGGYHQFGDGGGILIPAGTFNMYGGKITNCTTNSYGGGMYVSDSGTFNMNAGTISGCSAGENGGGVAIGHFFIMNGGNITGCRAGNYGGGVHVDDMSGIFTMTGGNIIKCSAGYDGGGVHVIDDGVFKVNGTAIVKDNTKTNAGINNVYINSFLNLNLLAGGFIGKIGVSNLVSKGDQFGSAESNATGAGNFFADNNANLIGSVSGINLVWAEKPATYVEVDTWAGLNKSITEWTYTDETRVVAVNASILDRGAGNNTEGINVYGKIILTTNASPAGNEAVIDGREYGRLFNVSSGGNLTLCGNGTSTTLNLTRGRFSGNGAGIFVDGYGNLTIEDGVMITNCTAVSLTCGGGVHVNESARFLMKGGKISGCNACYGGGVENDGIFEMSGGSIEGNDADDWGAGVENHRGIFNISGDAVIDANNNVMLYILGDGIYNINVASTFEGNVGNISLYKNGVDNVTAWAGKVVVKNGASAKNKFALSTASAYSGYELTASGSDLIFSKKSTPSPSYSGSSKQTGYTQILSDGQVALTPYVTTTPTVAPTPVTPTAKPTTQTTTQPTQSSPAPVAGLIAGLGAAVLVLARLRR